MKDTELSDMCRKALSGMPSQDRARVCYRLAVQLAQFAFKECEETGLDPRVEYDNAIDEAQRARGVQGLSPGGQIQGFQFPEEEAVKIASADIERCLNEEEVKRYR